MLLAILLTLSHLPSFAQEKANLESLQIQIDELKSSLATIEARGVNSESSVRTMMSRSLMIGGFFENSLSGVWGSETQTQIVADSHRFGINFEADISDRFRLLSQVTYGFSYPLLNEHNNSSHGFSSLPTTRKFGGLAPGVLLSQAYGEYFYSNTWRFQTGMGYSPFGYAYQVREPILFMKRKGPQLIRTNGNNRVVIADPFWEGINAVYSPTPDWQVNLYSNTGLEHSGRLGGGVRVEYTSSGFAAGLSSQTGGQDSSTYTSLGAHVKFETDRFGFLGEWAKNHFEESRPESFYLQPYLFLYDRKLTVFLMMDYVKNSLGETVSGSSVISDPYIKWEHSLGLIYRVLDQFRIRWDLTSHDYVGPTAIVAGSSRDYFSSSLSTGVSF